MRDAVLPYLIMFMPLMVTTAGWAKAYRARRIQPLHPFALMLLAVVTLFATVVAGVFIYFEVRPVHIPPWESPEVAIFAWLFLLGLFCIVLSFLAFRLEPKWLFWVLAVASFWLTGLGFMAVAAY